MDMLGELVVEQLRRLRVDWGEWALPPPMLPGWVCKVPTCGVFNGEAKECLMMCRCCGGQRTGTT